MSDVHVSIPCGAITDYPCGCRNQIDPVWGVLRSVSKCDGHRSHMGRVGLQYFLDIGAIHKDGIPHHAQYIQEMRVAFEEVGFALEIGQTGKRALDVGAGIGNYCPYLLRLGYDYQAIEMDPWAARWLAMTFDVPVANTTFEQFPNLPFDLILAVHVVEHLIDAPRCLRRMKEMLVPGGRIIVVVPDDTDPVNPDHLWFFNSDSLRSVFEAIGFQDIRISVRQVVAREKFIYCTAVV